MAELVGEKIGNYRIQRLLGEGGMGRVFEAVDDQIGRRAAIKILHAQFAHNSEAFTRFLNEARAVNIVQHPGVVSVYEFGQTPDGSPYIVMEFLEGEGLDKRLQRLGRMSLGAIRIARQVASALVAAHAKHVVHRDLKPSNVMLVPDPDMPGGERAKVVDFGIAKVSDEHGTSSYKTRAGAILGTPTYMSPEQCRGAGEVTEKADVYSLGVMIYEMLVGRPPFIADGEGEVMGMHLFKPPPPLHSLEPTLPLDLVDLVHSMLVKEQERRPTMVEVARELDRIGQRLSGQRSAAMLEMAAMANEPPLPGPKTLPIDAQGNLIASKAPEPAEAASAVPNVMMDGAALKSGPQMPTLGVSKLAQPATDAAKAADAATPAEMPPAEMKSSTAGNSSTAVIATPRKQLVSSRGRGLRIGIPIAAVMVAVAILGIALARRHASSPPQTPKPLEQQTRLAPADLGVSALDLGALDLGTQDLSAHDLSARELSVASSDLSPPAAEAATSIVADGSTGTLASGDKKPAKKLKKKKPARLRNEEIEYVE